MAKIPAARSQGRFPLCSFSSPIPLMLPFPIDPFYTLPLPLALPSVWPHLPILSVFQSQQLETIPSSTFLLLPSLLSHPHLQQGNAICCLECWSVHGPLGLGEGWESPEARSLECVFLYLLATWPHLPQDAGVQKYLEPTSVWPKYTAQYTFDWIILYGLFSFP